MPNRNVELRSDEVQEILSKVPHWMIRWGNIVILIMLFVILLMSWIIKYPEIVTAEITISTQNPPQRLVAKTSGNLEKILVTNQQMVTSGTPLAVIQNSADYKDVFKLMAIIDKNEFDAENLNFPFNEIQNLKLGEIDQAYAVFEKTYTSYKLNSELQPYQIEGNAQEHEVAELQNRLAIAIEQKLIAENELKIKAKELERYRKLYSKGVIATQEWDSKNLDYLRFDKELRDINSSISQIRSSLNDLDRSSKTTIINETKDEVSLFRDTMQAYNQLKKAISDWELAYLLRSAIDGRVTYLQVWKENQTINSGDNVFAVIPSYEGGYVGKVRAKALNSGKIATGQSVNIRLANFPDREFGILKGKIKYISLTPDKEGNLIIDVNLTQGLKSSYNKTIPFQQEMTGTADIITDDLRLAERLLYQFRDIFNRPGAPSSDKSER